MFAIIEINGKQFLVKKGDKLRTESPKIGEVKVLLLNEGEETEIGMPYLEKKKAEIKTLNQGRDKKKIVFRYHSKTRHRKKAGHRQHYTDIQLLDIK